MRDLQLTLHNYIWSCKQCHLLVEHTRSGFRHWVSIGQRQHAFWHIASLYYEAKKILTIKQANAKIHSA